MKNKRKITESGDGFNVDYNYEKNSHLIFRKNLNSKTSDARTQQFDDIFLTKDQVGSDINEKMKNLEKE